MPQQNHVLNKKKKKRRLSRLKISAILAAIGAVVLLLIIVLIRNLFLKGNDASLTRSQMADASYESGALLESQSYSEAQEGPEAAASSENGESGGYGTQKGPEAAASSEGGESGGNGAQDSDPGLVEMIPTDFVAASFRPYHTENTDPAKYLDFTQINVDGYTLDDISEYHSSSRIFFNNGDSYTDTEGIVTFRGNNYRDNPTFGTASGMQTDKFQELWSTDTGTLVYDGATWTGSGWTGQPLMMKWPRDVKAHMNMYDWAKNDDSLVEVIYACMDGYIYFLDLVTGSYTRDRMYVGWTFKGAGALDPRGYPIMYVGAGYDSDNGSARAFIINLLDCSIMYTFGDWDDFSLRGALSYFDSSPLVDAETDTLIYPGENGILYLIKLNTDYDPENGTLSINPNSTVKWRYYGLRTNLYSYWLGMEDSAVVLGEYLFVADNGGYFWCMNLNTLEVVWVQDVLDDSNSTPVLSIEDGHPYLYISTSYHLGWRSNDTCDVPIWKIDAENGEIIWQRSWECYSLDGVSGGVLSSPALGKGDLGDYVYFTMSMTGSQYGGVLICLDKKTGEVVWEHEAMYAWSSPLCVYNAEGKGRVIYATSYGKMYILDGKTGETLDRYDFGDGQVLEASPAVYNDYLVMGIRSCKIFGFRLT